MHVQTDVSKKMYLLTVSCKFFKKRSKPKKIKFFFKCYFNFLELSYFCTCNCKAI